MQVQETLYQMVSEISEANGYLYQLLDTIVKEQNTLNPLVLRHLSSCLALIEVNMAANADNFHVHLTTLEKEACSLLDDAYRIQTTILKKLLKFQPTP